MEVLIDRSVCQKIRSIDIHSIESEIGGILLGSIYEDYILVSNISFPNKFDKAGQHSFFRHKKPAQKIVNQEWNRSGGQVIYLGEWHTHFEKGPRPSQVDKRMINAMLKTSKMEIDFILLLIIGYEKVWLGFKRKGDNLKKIGSLIFTTIPYSSAK